MAEKEMIKYVTQDTKQKYADGLVIMVGDYVDAIDSMFEAPPHLTGLWIIPLTEGSPLNTKRSSSIHDNVRIDYRGPIILGRFRPTDSDVPYLSDDDEDFSYDAKNILPLKDSTLYYGHYTGVGPVDTDGCEFEILYKDDWKIDGGALPPHYKGAVYINKPTEKGIRTTLKDMLTTPGIVFKEKPVISSFSKAEKQALLDKILLECYRHNIL